MRCSALLSLVWGDVKYYNGGRASGVPITTDRLYSCSKSLGFAFWPSAEEWVWRWATDPQSIVVQEIPARVQVHPTPGTSSSRLRLGNNKNIGKILRHGSSETRLTSWPMKLGPWQTTAGLVLEQPSRLLCVLWFMHVFNFNLIQVKR